MSDWSQARQSLLYFVLTEQHFRPWAELFAVYVDTGRMTSGLGAHSRIAASFCATAYLPTGYAQASSQTTFELSIDDSISTDISTRIKWKID